MKHVVISGAFPVQRVVSYPQNLLPAQHAHISLIGSRSQVLWRNVCHMVGVFFVLDEDRLDVPTAVTFEVVQLHTL